MKITVDVTRMSLRARLAALFTGCNEARVVITVCGPRDVYDLEMVDATAERNATLEALLNAKWSDNNRVMRAKFTMEAR